MNWFKSVISLFAYLEEIIHVRHETNFNRTRILFYCSPSSRTTAKSPVLCSLGHIVLSDWKPWMHCLGRHRGGGCACTHWSDLSAAPALASPHGRRLLWVCVRACENANALFHFPNGQYFMTNTTPLQSCR